MKKIAKILEINSLLLNVDSLLRAECLNALACGLFQCALSENLIKKDSTRDLVFFLDLMQKLTSDGIKMYHFLKLQALISVVKSRVNREYFEVTVDLPK